MMGLSPRERLMVTLVITAAIATVFYLFVWTPQTAERDRLAQDLTAKRAEVARLKTLAEQREEKEREFQALSGRIRLVEVKLPPEREIPNLIRQLQASAQAVEIKMMLLRPGQTQAGPPATPAGTAPAPRGPAPAPGAAPPPKPRYLLFRLDLSFEGSYSSLMALLGRLEDFPRFIVLKQVQMNPGDLPRLRGTIVAETFILPKEATGSP
jgi:hypothetical protein